jgi:glycolate oxidase
MSARCRWWPAARGPGSPGGALPLADGIVLSLARFNRILSIDPVNRTARVQPGVRNLAISEAAGPTGSTTPRTPLADRLHHRRQRGGELGGVHCLKYGLTVHNVLAVKLVTMDGELSSWAARPWTPPGYDLLALFIGSEGMLGVTVEVTVRLLPVPERAQVVLAAYDDVEKAGIGRWARSSPPASSRRGWR